MLSNIFFIKIRGEPFTSLPLSIYFPLSANKSTTYQSLDIHFRLFQIVSHISNIFSNISSFFCRWSIRYVPQFFIFLPWTSISIFLFHRLSNHTTYIQARVSPSLTDFCLLFFFLLVARMSSAT